MSEELANGWMVVDDTGSHIELEHAERSKAGLSASIYYGSREPFADYAAALDAARKFAQACPVPEPLDAGDQLVAEARKLLDDTVMGFGGLKAAVAAYDAERKEKGGDK